MMVAPAAPVAAPMEEPSVPDNLFQQAVAQYPILGRQNIAYQARPKGVQPTGMLEFYSPEETDRPAGMPLGQQGVAVFDSKTTPLDILADWTSHYGRVKDPVLKNNYDTFVKTFTPEQNKMLKEQYKYARENEGETRTFDQWKEVSGIPAWYRGYLFNQWPKSFIDKFYTAAQLQHLNEVRPYLNLQGNEKKMTKSTQWRPQSPSIKDPPIEVELPDGTILEAPAGADPSKVAKNYLAKNKPSAPVAPPPMTGAKQHAGDSAAWTLAQGLTGAGAGIASGLAMSVPTVAYDLAKAPFEMASGLWHWGSEFGKESSKPDVRKNVKYGTAPGETPVPEMPNMGFEMGGGFSPYAIEAGREFGKEADPAFEKARTDYVKKLDQDSPFMVGFDTAYPVSETVGEFFLPGKALNYVAKLEKANKALRLKKAAERAAEIGKAKSLVQGEEQFTGGEATVSSKSAHELRKEAISNELAKNIAEAKNKLASKIVAVQKQGEADLKVIEQKIKDAEKITETTHAAHENAAVVAELPEPPNLKNNQKTAGEILRGHGEPAFESAKKKQEAAQAPWESASDVARTKQQQGVFFESSETGKNALKRLRSLMQGGIEKGPLRVDERGKAIGPPTTADQQLQKIARDLYRGISGENRTRIIQGKEIQVHHPVDFEVVRSNVRRLRDIQNSAEPLGYGSNVRRYAKDLADDTEKALVDFVGKENYPKDAYAEASKPINFWQSELGQALHGREDIPYFGTKGTPHLTATTSLPGLVFKDAETVSTTMRLIGLQETTQAAEMHLAENLEGKTADQIEKWFPDNVSWLRAVPGLKEKALTYVATLRRNEAVASRAASDIKKAENAAEALQKEHAKLPKQIASDIDDLQKQHQKDLKILGKTATQQYEAAAAEKLAREKIAKQIDMFFTRNTSEQIDQHLDKLVDSLENLPGTTKEQINALRQQADAAKQAMSEAEKTARRQKLKQIIVSYVGKGALGAAGFGAARSIYNAATEQ